MAHMPDPIEAARVCEEMGCDSIVCHLREDRRHIKEADVINLRKAVKTRLNLEMSTAKDIVDIACRIKPDQATLVPERRAEITTEGGLDVRVNLPRIKTVVRRLREEAIAVSLFINPVRSQIDAALGSGAKIIELHTGSYANAKNERDVKRQLEILRRMAAYAMSLGLEVNAGHGLDYENTRAVARIEGMNELNIGHSIVSRAVFVGIGNAVREMMGLVR